MTVASVRTGAVQVSGARGHYELHVDGSDDGSTVRCSAAGLEVTLDADARRRLGQALQQAATRLAAGSLRGGHLESMGSADVLVQGRGVQRFEVDVVHDQREQVSAVLLTCEALGVDGVLDEVAARRLGELLALA